MNKFNQAINIAVIVTDVFLIMSGLVLLVREQIGLTLMSWGFALIITYLWAKVNK